MEPSTLDPRQKDRLLLYNPTMKQTNLRAACKSALQPGTVTGRRSETFEDLLYLFSSEDKYKGFSLY